MVANKHEALNSNPLLPNKNKKPGTTPAIPATQELEIEESRSQVSQAVSEKLYLKTTTTKNKSTRVVVALVVEYFKHKA